MNYRKVIGSKKYTALFLAAAFLLGGCAGSAPDGGATITQSADAGGNAVTSAAAQNETGGSSATATAGAAATNAAAVTDAATTAAATSAAVVDSGGEPVILTVIMENVDEGIHDTAVDKAITEATGVVIDRINATTDKIKMIAASGDLPDIIQFFSTADVAKNMMDSGALLPLDDLLDAYGQNLKKAIPIGLKWSKDIYSQGEATYIIPTRTTKTDMNIPYRNGFVSGFMTRWDIYKAIGMPEMSNEDDYLDVLKQMVDYSPTTADGNKVYGLSGWTDWGLWPYNISYAVCYGFYSYDRLTGELVDQYADPDSVFWDAVKFYSKAWNMGILDPEAFTIKSDQYADKVSTGEVLASGFTNWQPSTEYCGEEAICVKLPGAFPYMNNLYANENPMGLRDTHSLGISASTKHPEKAMQLIDYLNSEEGARTMYSGIKGEDWDIIDGTPQFIGVRLENFLTNNAVDPDYNTKRGIWAYYPLSVGSVQPSDGYPVELADSLDYIIMSATPAERDFASFYGGEGAVFPGQAYQTMLAAGIFETTTNESFAVLLMDPNDDDVTRINNQVDQYLQANIAKIVMSATDDEFESNRAKAIEDILAFGYEEAWDKRMANYEAAKERAEAFN